MLHYLHAGLMDAGFQAAAVAAIALIFVLPAFDGITFKNAAINSTTSDSIWTSTCPFLVWSQVLAQSRDDATGPLSCDWHPRVANSDVKTESRRPLLRALVAIFQPQCGD